MRFIMKKLMLFIFVPFMLNGMEHQYQATLTPGGQLVRPVFISTSKLTTLNGVIITADQKKLLEKILTYKKFDRSQQECTGLIISFITACFIAGPIPLLCSFSDNCRDRQAAFIYGK